MLLYRTLNGIRDVTKRYGESRREQENPDILQSRQKLTLSN